MARPPLRARDLRSNIKELGFEQGVVATLEHMLEEHTANKQQLRGITELLAACINQVETMIKVGEGMQKGIDELKRIHAEGDGNGERG